jgi:serine protease AprX
MYKKILFSFFLIFSFTLFAQSPQSKIDKKLADRLEKGEKADCIIFMREQADVSPASVLRTKLEKGQWVFDLLRNTAERTQRNVLNFLQKEHSTYQSFWVVNIIHTQLDLDLAEKIAAFPEVAQIFQNGRFKGEEPIAEVSASPTSNGARAIEWGIGKIGADQVWAGSSPLTQGANGTGVVIGGQDTGYGWKHPAIKSKYRGWNGTTADHNYNWHDCIDFVLLPNTGTNPCGIPAAVPCDDGSHGTHTMGTMVGSEGSNDIGVAPGAKWIGVRNMERGWGRLDTYVEGFQWFLAPTNSANTSPDVSKAPHVINNSWGCPPGPITSNPATSGENCDASNFVTMELAVNNLRASGVVVVVSAGNDGSACSSINNPAAIFVGSFSVGATNSSDGIAGFSSRGPVVNYGASHPKPDVSAPGVSVRSSTPATPVLISTMPDVYENPATANYATFNGTSMAGPHVAGAVALMISAKPALAGQVVTIENILRNTAFAISDNTCGTGTISGTAVNNVYGAGRINVFAAVQQAVLPIELIGFYGKAEKELVRLFWASASEVNNDFFEIERSRDFVHWEKILQEKGHGTTTLPYDYTGEDRQPFHGVNYYRLKQIDFDGKSKIFEVIAVDFKSRQVTTHVFPVPVQNTLYVNAEGLNDGVFQTQIFDLQGRLISQQSFFAENNTLQAAIEVDNFPNGTYFLLLKNENGTIVGRERFVKN